MISWYKLSNIQFTASGYRNGGVVGVELETYKFLGQNIKSSANLVSETETHDIKVNKMNWRKKVIKYR